MRKAGSYSDHSSRRSAGPTAAQKGYDYNKQSADHTLHIYDADAPAGQTAYQAYQQDEATNRFISGKTPRNVEAAQGCQNDEKNQ